MNKRKFSRKVTRVTRNFMDVFHGFAQLSNFVRTPNKGTAKLVVDHVNEKFGAQITQMHHYNT